MHRSRSLLFEPDAAHLASVRDFTLQAAEAFGEVDREVLAVVAGELAANAAVHQSGTAEITISLAGEDCVEVSVRDGDAALPHVVDHEPWSTSGHRGMQLVSALAHSWGVEPTPAGKRVWARVPLLSRRATR